MDKRAVYLQRLRMTLLRSDHDAGGQEGPKAQLFQSLEEKRLPCARKAQASKSHSGQEEPHPLATPGVQAWVHYWVLQSPSLLWAIFTFFSSFCSSDSASRTSFGFWYCRQGQGEDNSVTSPLPTHTHTHPSDLFIQR